MKVSVERINDAVLVAGRNEAGNEIIMDGASKIGGTGGGASPMEVVLMALAGCSTMDVISILDKMKQKVDSYHVDVDGDRDSDKVPAIFTKIHLTYHFEGDLDATKAARAVELSQEKYCSVSVMLNKTAEITYSVIVNGEEV